jgi:peptide/nickel transport system substrate-binding protein
VTKRARKLTAAAFLLVIVAAGIYLFQKTKGGFAGENSAAEAVYRTALFSDLSTQNPWSRYGPNNSIWNSYATAGTYAALFGYTTKRFDWVPLLAADFPPALTFDPGVKLWRSRVSLKRGIRWSDGTEITAHDVAFTFDAIAKLGSNNLGGNFSTFAPDDVLSRAEAVDDYTVEFFLHRKDGRFNFGVLMAPVLSRAFWEPKLQAALATADPLREMFNADVRDEPVFGGYLYGTWERGSFVNRPRNPNFSMAGSVERLYANGAVELQKEGLFSWAGYGKPEGKVDLEVVTGPYANEVHYQVYGTQATGVLALQGGQVDYLFNPLGLEKGFRDQLATSPNIKLIENSTNGFRYLSFNLRRQPMNILQFRQAVAVLIDREFISERVLQGTAFPLYSVVPPANSFWHNPDTPVYGKGMDRGQRVREAVRLLRSAGFSWESEPVLEAGGNVKQPGRGLKLPNGQPLRPLELLGPGDAYDPLRATFAMWVERWLNEVGIPLRANLTSFNVVAEKVFDQQDFDMWILGWTLNIYPSHLHSFFHSSNAGLRGQNAQGYSNPEYDRLVNQFLAETDDLQRARTLALQLQVFLARDLPYIVLFDTPIVEAFRADRLKYPVLETMGGIQYNAMTGDAFLTTVQLIK